MTPPPLTGEERIRHYENCYACQRAAAAEIEAQLLGLDHVAVAVMNHEVVRPDWLLGTEPGGVASGGVEQAQVGPQRMPGRERGRHDPGQRGR